MYKLNNWIWINYIFFIVIVVHSLNHVWLFVTLWTADARLLCPSQSPEVCWNSHPLSQSCYLTILSSAALLLLPSIFSRISVFPSESAVCIMWPKYWSFSCNSSLSSKYSWLISFRIDWFDLPAVQGTLKSLLQHHSIKASVLWYSAFFMVQLSHLYMTTGKIIALTRRTFAGKVMPLFYNMLSRFFFFFFFYSFPSKEQVSYNFMAAVTIHSDFGAQENKVCHCFHCVPI